MGTNIHAGGTSENEFLRKTLSFLRHAVEWSHWNDTVKSTRIGLVFNSDLAYSRGVLRGVKQFAQTHPHWILTPIDPETLTAEALRALQPAGLIAHVSSPTLVRILRESGKRLVNVSRALSDLPFPRVGVDHVAVGRMAAAHLWERGLRHYGFIGHPRHAYSSEREAGFREMLAGAEQSLSCFYERSTRSYRSRSRLLALDVRFQRWLRSLPKPTGIFACHDVWGFQAAEACRLIGIRVPDDVAIIGVDNDDLLCELARPSLSSVAIPAERIGQEAASLLDHLLVGAKRPKEPVLIPPLGVVTRQSSDVLALDDPEIVAAVRFIQQHAHLPIRVGDVLRQVSVSRRALERRFFQSMNRSVAEEIRRAHVSRAKELIAGTDLMLGEVARQSGFTDARQLSVVFRQHMAQTPSDYRRQFRGQRGAPTAASIP
jgi:LacI family transcriptional regulator